MLVVTDIRFKRGLQQHKMDFVFVDMSSVLVTVRCEQRCVLVRNKDAERCN